MKDRVIQFSGLLLLVGLICLPSWAMAEENRLALVIGNGSYKESPLSNPLNDASDMADTLEELGFTVILRTDANRREMAKAIREFGRELKRTRGVGLFYYAGHGMQIDNRNYLIPIGTPLEEEDEVPYESVDVGSVLAKMESAGNSLNLLILDACRNNPFPSQFRSSNRGLARVEAPVGSLVVYSTAPGNVAADGKGRNGVFTGALLEQLRERGLSLTQTIRRTRAAVVKATNGQQVPWASSSLLQDYYFNEPKPSTKKDDDVAPAIANNNGKANSVTDPDVVFWNSIQGSALTEDYQAYLDQFPKGVFSALATARLQRLNNKASNAELAKQAELAKEAKLAKATENAGNKVTTDATQLALLDTAMDQPKTTKQTLQQTQGSLLVTVEPPSARVRIMNIVEKYTPGMLLDRSRSYDVYVTKPGYESFRQSITLDEEVNQVAVVLPKRDAAAPITVPVPGGEFLMGCSIKDSLCEAYEKPRHTVTVPPFSITRTEITVAEFNRFVLETGAMCGLTAVVLAEHQQNGFGAKARTGVIQAMTKKLITL